MADELQITKTGNRKMSSEKPKRLNINMSQRDWKRLDEIMALMEADNTTDAVKDSFRLLEYFLRTAQAGGKFYKKTPDGEMSLIEFFGISA